MLKLSNWMAIIMHIKKALEKDIFKNVLHSLVSVHFWSLHEEKVPLIEPILQYKIASLMLSVRKED